MGTGKSSLAGALGPRLGAEVLASDIVRKELVGIPPEERRPERWGEGIYGNDFTTRTYDELYRRARERLGEGKIVILDASYREVAWRARARETARASGAPFLLLETVCPEATVRQRLAGRGAGASDGRHELLDRQREEFQPPLEIPEAERARIDTSAALEQVATVTLGAVYRRRLSAP